MIQNKTVLVTICCRGGSKGIPNKGLKVLGGKPLIQWTTALIPALKYVDGIIVSSDSDAILECAKQNIHITMPTIFKSRDPKLATDTISRVEAIKDAVKWAEYYIGEYSIRKPFDIIVDLGVATPFKTAADVNLCIEMILGEYTHITTGFKGNHSPYFDMMEMAEHTYGYELCKQQPLPAHCRQQAAPTLPVYILNDAVNVWRRESLFTPKNHTNLHEMPPERSVHLDTSLDWAFAEFLLKEGYIK